MRNLNGQELGGRFYNGQYYQSSCRKQLQHKHTDCKIQWIASVGTKIVPLDLTVDSAVVLHFDTGKWEVRCVISIAADRKDSVDFTVVFKLLNGYARHTALCMRLDFDSWSADNYVLMPAAAYNGNRYEARKMKYPPMFRDNKDLRADIHTIISDVPRLNLGSGPSRMQLITRDLATPAVGFHAPHTGSGFWLLTHQDTCLGDTGIAVEESDDRNRAFIELTTPGMRRDYRYTICNNAVPCEDRGADFSEWDGVELKFRLYFFDCPDIQMLFDYFVEIRKDLTGPVMLQHTIPFSSAWGIQEDKYNRENWEEEHGYYSVGMRENVYQDWQIGWVGGLMATYPLLMEGSQLSRE